MVKSLQSFVNEWYNKPLNVDKAFGNQCFDVLQQYNKEILNGPYITGPTAIAAFDNNTFSQTLYTKILNGPTNYPKPGDFVFFKYNHVALVLVADGMSMTVFEQNYPSQGYYDKDRNFIGTGVCRIGLHTYTNCAGWITPK